MKSIWQIGTIGFGLLALAAGGACSAGTSDSASGGGDTGSGGNTTTTGNTTSGQGGAGTTGAFMSTTGTGQMGCDAGNDEDKDMDGYTITQGDCNDCDANVNPGAIEVIVDPSMGQGGAGGMAPADENCDGDVDEVVPSCDTGLPLDSSNPLDGARAIELCQLATDPAGWGVVSAQWVRANGVTAPASAQFGILPGFGTNVPPRAGSSLLGLSSGRARTPGQPGACGSQSCNTGPGTAPPGFPQLVCNASPNINDDIGLEVTLKAPTNATGYKFDFRFYSFEFAEWICTSFNDQFIALANPAPMGSINGNISFDSMNNPVSVNLGFFDSCDTCSDWAQFCNSNCPPMPNPCCPSGAGDLAGSGFELDAGATAWLQTSAPIGGGEQFSLRFAIWDAGDTALDSSVIIDNFEWIANGGTVNVGTNPVPE